MVVSAKATIAALEWMQAVVKQLGGRDALEDFVSRNKAANDSFTGALRSMYLTNHSFPARLRSVAPDLRYGIGLLPRGNDKGATGIVRGGWSNGVPVGVKAESEAWLLTQYLSATKEGGGWFMQEQVRRAHAGSGGGGGKVYGWRVQVCMCGGGARCRHRSNEPYGPAQDCIQSGQVGHAGDPGGPCRGWEGDKGD